MCLEQTTSAITTWPLSRERVTYRSPFFKRWRKKCLTDNIIKWKHSPVVRGLQPCWFPYVGNTQSTVQRLHWGFLKPQRNENTHTTIHIVMLHPAEMKFLAFVKSKQRERCSKEIRCLFMECSDFYVYILMDSLRTFLVYNQSTHEFIIFCNFVL